MAMAGPRQARDGGAVRPLPPPSAATGVATGTSLFTTDALALVSHATRGPGFQGAGAASDWWLPGPARLCLTLGEGTAAVQLRKRRFGPIPRLAIIGPTDRAHRIETENARVVSFAITPLGWSRLLRRPASLYRNLVLPLGDLARPAVALALADALAGTEPVGSTALDDLLTPLAPPHRDDALILQLARLVDDPTTHQVRDMHVRLGISEARLRSLALRHFGSPTKILLRHARFLRSLARVDYTPGRNSYADIDPTYHDVSHFLRDADYFLGTTPRRFRLLSSQH